MDIVNGSSQSMPGYINGGTNNYFNRCLNLKISSNLDCDSISEKLMIYLQNQLGQNLPSISEVAKALGYSERTLRRKLSNEGNSFRLLLETMRKRHAAQFLSNSDITLIDISFSLGYKDQSTFNHAFRSWYNESPGQYRKRMIKNSKVY